MKKIFQMEVNSFSLNFFLIVLGSEFFFGDCEPPAPSPPSPCEKPQLEIQVSPVKKHIQIYWNFHVEVKEGWIGVYSQSPDVNDPEKNRVDERINIDKPMGWHITGIKSLDNTKLDLKFDGPTNLGFFACAWRKNNAKDEALIVTELRTYPRWMENYWENISKVPLNALFIPGTHDSGSFEGEQKKQSFFENLKKSLPGVKDQAFCQDSNIKAQLMLGIRYFDIRVKRKGDEYWTAHGTVVMENLAVIIDQVNEFVSKTTKEIVIFDVHQTMDIDSEDDHRKLANFLKEKFTVDNKPSFVDPKDFGSTPWTATPEAILAKGRVIVAYINVEFQRKDNCGILWPKVYQYWGDKQKIDDLKNYVYEKIQGRIGRKEFTDRLTAVMGQLTPTAKTVLGNIGNGLNDQAQNNDESIFQWFLDPKIGLDTNVLTVDYFRSSGIVRLAFMWNERKFFKTNNCDPPTKFNDEYYQHILLLP